MDSGGEESGDKTSVRSLEDAEDEDRDRMPSCPVTECWSSWERSVIFAGKPGHSAAIAVVSLGPMVPAIPPDGLALQPLTVALLIPNRQ